ncbi:alpha,alpha-trehalase TreF [Solitalea sp. MAHUQ-68]|uniref:Alpha,alpha-trehalase TreF n=1 Tax=Solitalea agri TaxID=2953739 RepID=A0A9X2JEH6_9SPHI|nr:alpha,alpha-trehalase TreF [Solitalea agri]MCO4292406.1 alpha,alpha-trehalase TreF [Solitalea agri]
MVNFRKRSILLFIHLLFLLIGQCFAQYIPDRDLKELFRDVQLQKVFADSKTFADSSPINSSDSILKAYRVAKQQPGFDLKLFVEKCFTLPPNKTDFQTKSSFPPIDDHLQELWKVLERHQSSSIGTLIGLPKPYIVPGGRFNEIYYWDSYFTMLGLRASGRVDLIENMVDNFAFLIDQYGHIPNGNRTYYLSRSQQPYFSLMVELLAEMKGASIYEKYLPQLLAEYTFWMKGSEQSKTINRVVKLPDGNTLNRYWDEVATPRAESYREDVELAKESKKPEVLYRNIRAACESGWDFSSRWFKDGISLGSIHTTEIVPVDLNCLLVQLETTISKAYQQKGETTKASLFTQKAEKRRKAILKYCWSEKLGFFMDYDFIEQRPTSTFTLAGLFPLFFKIANPQQATQVANKVKRYFLLHGGLVTTVTLSSQQWDAPNGWAPLQWIGYKGLKNYDQNALADSIKVRWIRTVERQYYQSGKLLEKYNVLYPEIPGGGGEYPTQDGFGWTNGVYLQMKKE